MITKTLNIPHTFDGSLMYTVTNCSPSARFLYSKDTRTHVPCDYINRDEVIQFVTVSIKKRRKMIELL